MWLASRATELGIPLGPGGEREFAWGGEGGGIGRRGGGGEEAYPGADAIIGTAAGRAAAAATTGAGPTAGRQRRHPGAHRCGRHTCPPCIADCCPCSHDTTV